MDLADLHALLGAHPPVLDAPVDGPPLVGALLPGPDFVDRAWGASERSPAWLRSFQALFDAGRLGGTGHLCLLSAGNGEPEAVAALAQEGGCSALIATERMLATVARRYAHRVPLLVDIGDPDAVDAAAIARFRHLGAVGVCVPDTGPGRRVVSAAAAEGLVAVGVSTTAPGYATQWLGAALGWAQAPARAPHEPPGYRWGDAVDGLPAPEAAHRAATSMIRLLRQEIVDAWSGRLGLLVDAELARRDDAVRTAALGRRAGSMGIVVNARTFGDATDDVATLHAVQDVWAIGELGPG